ncbi:MAG: hypothetical protein ABI231_04865 [Candidatus Tumulicola sp.]
MDAEPDQMIDHQQANGKPVALTLHRVLKILRLRQLAHGLNRRGIKRLGRRHVRHGDPRQSGRRQTDRER